MSKLTLGYHSLLNCIYGMVDPYDVQYAEPIQQLHNTMPLICAVQKEEKEKRKGCEFFLWGGTRLE